ncbi:MAG: S8 family serine peptidase, partial [Acidimicrobiia bacterium]
MPTKRTVVAVAGVLLPLALNLPASPLRSTPADHASPKSHDTEAQPSSVTGEPDGGDGRLTIRLATGAFDPLEGVPEVAAPLRAGEDGVLLVQVHPPSSPAVRAAISGAGGEILGSIPEATYLVRAGPGVAGALRKLAAVRWVGPYHPAYKLSPGLAAQPGEPVHVYAHPGVDTTRLATEAARLPGVSEATPAGSRLVVAAAAPAALPALARLTGTEWLEPVPHQELHNGNALWVSDTGVRDTLGAAAPGRLDGSGQVTAVADTGVNYIPEGGVPAQAAFSDCAQGPRACLTADYVQAEPGPGSGPLGSVVPTGAHHRKLAAYLAVAGDPLARSREPAWHGTHTAGSVAGDYPDAAGAYGTRSREADGVAPAARLVYQDIEAAGSLALPDDHAELFAQAYDLDGDGAYDPDEDARVHSNSYGADLGLDQGAQPIRIDDFMANHPDMLVVFSASNDGPRPFTLPGGQQSSKNALIVCASENGGQPTATYDGLADFSSHGPTADGRLKPDLCTPGQVVLSPRGGSADDDHYQQGTSMSAPIAAGLATLVRQYFWDGYGPATGSGFAPGSPDTARRHNPSAALVKAALVNSAQRMRGAHTGDDGDKGAEDGMWPSAGQGYGRVMLDSTLHFTGERRNLFVADHPADLETGGTAEYALDTAPGEPLTLTLAWTDPASAFAAGGPELVNDLDLEVTAPDGTVFLGNEFNTQSPFLGTPGNPGAEVGESVAGGLADRRNNLEAVRIAAPAPGRWTVRVKAADVPLGPQGFGLVASGRMATDTPRISLDAARARPGTGVPAYLLGTGLSGAAVDGFTRLAPSVYQRLVTVGSEAVTVGAAGVEAVLAADDDLPVVSGTEVESLAADTARIRWSTDERSWGEVVLIDESGDTRRFPDVAAVAEYPGLTTPTIENQGGLLDQPVVAATHQVLVTGLSPGATYRYEVVAGDEAGNAGPGASGEFTSSAAIFAPDALDVAQLRSADAGTGRPMLGPEQPWGTSAQLFAGHIKGGGPNPLPLPELGTAGAGSINLMPAFMFRLPDGVDAGRITGASVQLFSGHDLVAENDRPAYSLDLLGSGVEAEWGPGTSYETVDRAPADVHLVPEPTLHRGGNVAYTFAVACNDLPGFVANLAGDAAGRRALAFRLRSLSSQTASALAFETGLGRRSRGFHLRPRLLLHLDGADPQPCRPHEPAPTISTVLVDHVDDTSAVVTWRTDVPADSTVYFRRGGDAVWTPVSSPLRVTQHMVRVAGLAPVGRYEFAVRSVGCGGTAVDDNGGAAYALFSEAYEAPVVSRAFATPGATGQLVGWTTNQPATSTVRYGPAPDALDQRLDSTEMVTSHRLTLTGLDPCRLLYFVVESTNEGGITGRSPVLAFDRSGAGTEAVVAFDFDDGPQGFSASPPEGSGGLSGVGPGSGEPEPSLNPTTWSHRSEPVFAGSPAMRTVLRDSAPGYSSGADVRLVSPPVTLPLGSARLRFREWYLLAGTDDRATVEISADGGAGWTTVRDGAAPGHTGFPAPAMTEVALDPALAGQVVHLAFRLRAVAAG